MLEFLKIDPAWQVILAAGFLAAEINRAGENKRPTIDRHLLQALAFGIIADLLLRLNVGAYELVFLGGSTTEVAEASINYA